MATAAEPKAALTPPPDEVVKSASEPVKIDITRLPTEDEEDVEDENQKSTPSRTLLHIYSEPPCCHKHITPIPSASQERRFGPTPKQQKQRRVLKKAAHKSRNACESPTTALPPETQDTQEPSYFLHTPYLSFHLPPAVLYSLPIPSPAEPTLPSRYPPSKPLALIHSAWFWRSYTIQLGASLSLPGVIDPRGVVSWAHNDASVCSENDATALKGYKVRGWRLWGESGKSYVRGVREQRRAGVDFDDPDTRLCAAGDKIRANDVVRLTWSRPLSRQTRLYAFSFRGVEFQWKGTGTVSEARKCGFLLRFAHLKLVARVPLESTDEKMHGKKREKKKKKTREEGMREVCLGRYTSSIAAEKSGVLEVFDGSVLGVVEEWMPSLLGEGYEHGGDEKKKKNGDGDSGREAKIAKLKKGVLYQMIVATALCMASAEKEKRHTLIDLIIGIAENGGNGGG